MSEQALLIGVDGGQTATKAVVATVDGTILGLGRGGPSDHFHGPDGEERNRRAIHGAIGAALAAAGSPAGPVAAVGLGLTGAPTGGEPVDVVERIVRQLLATDRIVVAADYISNLAGASGGDPGVVVIAGGGAIAYGRDATGRDAIAGGFGFLLGDEGSAFDIGRRAIAAACRASDGRDSATMLEQLVLDAFDLTEMRQITRVVYHADFSRERISLLAPLVFQAMAEGDQAATAIVRTAGEELGRAAVAVIDQLGLAVGAVVYPTGGVFAAGAAITDSFATILARHHPTAEIRPPRFPPTIGALLLAQRASDRPLDPNWLARVDASLER